MTEDADVPDGRHHGQDCRHLPPPVRLADTIASVDPDPAPDPEPGRNAEQHRALRYD